MPLDSTGFLLATTPARRPWRPLWAKPAWVCAGGATIAIAGASHACLHHGAGRTAAMLAFLAIAGLCATLLLCPVLLASLRTEDTPRSRQAMTVVQRLTWGVFGVTLVLLFSA